MVQNQTQKPVAAVIMECNPFHAGHAHILRQAREKTGAEYVIVLLSGNYVQRGEPAVTDKYARAEAVLNAGADLVLELPYYIATGAADYFARGAVEIIDRLGVVTHLCFGSESGDLDAIVRTASVLAEEPPVFQETLREALRKGLSFPAARAQAVKAALSRQVSPAGGCGAVTTDPASSPGAVTTGPASSTGDASSILTDDAPNDLLGAEYCKILRKRGSAVKPVAVPRIKAPSAGELRKAILSGSSALPGTALSVKYPVSADLFSQALFARLSTCGRPEDFMDVPESLAAKIRAALPEAAGWDDFSMRLKSKDITYTHIRRALLHIFLGITKRDVIALEKAGLVGYARVLGLRRDAQDLLACIGRCAKIPLAVRPAADGRLLPPPFADVFAADLRASELYDLLRRQIYAEKDAPPPVPEAARRLLVI